MNDTFNEKDKLLLHTLDLLEEEHSSDFYEWIYKYLPKSYYKISSLEDQIKLNMLYGRSIKKLKLLLKQYRNEHSKAICAFEKHFSETMKRKTRNDKNSLRSSGKKRYLTNLEINRRSIR